MTDGGEKSIDLTYVDEEYADWAESEAERERILGSVHYAVPVATNGQMAFVDYKIAELFYLMWTADIATIESCESVYEGGPNEEAAPDIAMICFRDAEAATLFVTLVARASKEPGDLNDRMTDGNGAGDIASVWDWDMFFSLDGRRPVLRPSACFPLSDVPELVARLKRELGD